MRNALALLVFVAGVGTAQRWETERVDSAGWGSGVHMVLLSDGRLLLGYAHAGRGDARLASRDSAWTYEDVPVQLDRVEAVSLAPGDSGEVGFGLARRDSARYLLRTTAGWTHYPIPAIYEVQCDLGRFPTAFDSTGRPVALVYMTNVMALVRLAQDTWEFVDFIDGSPRAAVVPVELGRHADGRLWGMDILAVQDVGIDQVWMDRFEWTGSQWDVRTLAGGDFARMSGPAAALDPGGTPHFCFWCNGTGGPDGFACDSEVVDTGFVPLAGLAVDSESRKLVGYIINGTLRFAYRDVRGWHHMAVADGVSSFDIVAGPDGQPWIAYCTADGLFLARGVDITGVEERSTSCALRITPGVGIVRGVLWLGAGRSQYVGRTGLRDGPCAVLLDASGRRVMELHPGANDVRHLATGIYFIRAAPAQARAVRSVIIAE
jgi:hypothetical protein